jgi:hypothetical protein
VAAPAPARDVGPPRKSLPRKSFDRHPPPIPAAGLALAICRTRKAVDVAQRSIEILIGRLVTDETFRSAFRADAVATLTGFAESGYDLTALEIVALRATPLDAWERAAEHIDPRLQKASLCRVEERRSSDWKA